MAIDEVRFGELIGTVGALSGSVEEIKGYLANGAKLHTEIMSQLAVIVNNQNIVKKDLTEYQQQCDTDREELHERINGTENYQKNQKKIAAGIAASITFLAYGGAKFVEKVAGWFS